MKTMICPYLEHGAAGRVCNASVTLMEPDDCDTVEYCSSEEHYRCPLLLAHVLRGSSGSSGSRDAAAGAVRG